MRLPGLELERAQIFRARAGLGYWAFGLGSGSGFPKLGFKPVGLRNVQLKPYI